MRTEKIFWILTAVAVVSGLVMVFFKTAGMDSGSALVKGGWVVFFLAAGTQEIISVWWSLTFPKRRNSR